jgi:hypothetical protein
MKKLLTICLAALPVAVSIAQAERGRRHNERPELFRREAFRDGVFDLNYNVGSSVSGRNSIQVWDMFQLGYQYSGYEVQAVELRARKSEYYSEASAQANVNGYASGGWQRISYGSVSGQIFYLQGPAIVNQNLRQLRIDIDGPIYVESIRVRVVAPRDCRDDRSPCWPQPTPVPVPNPPVSYGYDFDGVMGGYRVDFRGQTLRDLYHSCLNQLSDLRVSSSSSIEVNGVRYSVSSKLPYGRDALCSLAALNARPRDRDARLALDAKIEGVLPIRLYVGTGVVENPRDVLDQYLREIMKSGEVDDVEIWGFNHRNGPGYWSLWDVKQMLVERVRY